MDCARAFSLRLDTAKNECVCIQAASEVALKEQTFWPLVGSDVMSTGWHTASNMQPPPPPPPQRTGGLQPGVRRHVPVSRVSVCLCDCFNIGFLSAVARCSPPAVCRH